MAWVPTGPTTMLLACATLLAGVLLPCDGWTFRGVVPQDAPVVSVAVWESRAFLAVPRVWRDPRDAVYTFLHDGPTLLAAPWPEPGQCLPCNATLAMRVSRARARLRGGPAPPRAFPTPAEQQLSRPECLQSATAVALEQGRGAARLWVLDSGEVPTHALAPGPRPDRARCPPKALVYNLRGNNQRVWMRPFDGVPSSAVSGLAVDPGAQDTRAYVGYPEAPGGAALIVLSLKNKAFWHVRLQGISPPTPQPRLRAEAETTGAPGRRRGRGSRRRVPRQAPVPRSPRPAPAHWDVVVFRGASKRPRMVFTPRDSAFIYDVTLDALRGPAPDANHRNDALVPASELGARRLVRKPGSGAYSSSGLLADQAGGLLFFQAAPGPGGEGVGAGTSTGTGTGAVMRWDACRGAGPLGFAVLHRDNGSLPLTSAIFLDGQGAAWAACTTFAAHHGYDTAIHHAYEDHEDEVQVEDDKDRVEYPDDDDEDDGVDSQDDADDDPDHVNLETRHADDVGHVNDLPPVFRRSNSCRFPRAVGWRIREGAEDCGCRADSGEQRAGPGAGPAGALHAAEPQEYVCMSPHVPAKNDAAASLTRLPSRRDAVRMRDAGKSEEANTIMITRRAGRNNDRGRGLGSAADYHKTVLVHDDDVHPKGRPVTVTHCVRLRWDEPEQ